jgi:omega-amidase
MLRILALQHDIVWEEKRLNHATVDRMLDAAAPPRGTLVVLAELFDTGFSLELEAIVDDQSTTWGRESAARRGITLLVGHAERGPDGFGRNCATLIADDGSLLGRYEKIHPFSVGRENERYRGGSTLLLRQVAGATVCPLICYDLRFPELWRLATIAGAEVFLLGASWPAARQAHWRALCIARAIENQAYVVAVNRVGRDPSLAYAGGSLIVDPRGEVVAEAGDAPAALSATLDLEALRNWRAKFPALRDLRRSHLGDVAVDCD